MMQHACSHDNHVMTSPKTTLLHMLFSMAMVVLCALMQDQASTWSRIKACIGLKYSHNQQRHSVVVDSIKYCWEAIVAQGLPEASGEARKNMISFHKSTDDHFLLFLQLLVPQLLHHSAQNAVSLIYLTAFCHLHLSIMWVYMTGEKNTWIEESDWCARCSAQCNAF